MTIAALYLGIHITEGETITPELLRAHGFVRRARDPITPFDAIHHDERTDEVPRFL